MKEFPMQIRMSDDVCSKRQQPGIAEFLQAYSRQLTDGLGIASPSLDVVFETEEILPTIAFGGDLIIPTPKLTKRFPPAEQIAEYLYRNLNLMLMAQNHAELDSTTDNASWEAHCRCVRGGLRSSRLADLSNSQMSADWEKYETAVSEYPEAICQILTNRVPRKLSLQIDEVRQEVYQALGLLTPPIEVKRTRDLPAGNWQVKILDFHLPPHKGRIDPIVLKSDLLNCAHILLRGETVDLMLTLLRRSQNTLVDAFLSRFSSTWITGVLRALLEERFPIRDLATILEALVAVTSAAEADLTTNIVLTPNTNNVAYTTAKPLDTEALDFNDYAAAVRNWMFRQIAESYSDQNFLRAFLISPELETQLRSSDGLASVNRFIVLHQLLQQMDLLQDRKGVVILTTTAARRIAYELIRSVYSDLPVLSFQELPQDIEIQSLHTLYS